MNLLEKLFVLTFIALLAGSSCYTNKKASKPVANHHHSAVQRDTLTLFDRVRNRKVPVALYGPGTEYKPASRRLVIVNHGYGQNKGDTLPLLSLFPIPPNRKLSAKG